MKQHTEQTESIRYYHLINNTCYRYVSDNFQFEYGAINVKPRFHISEMIEDNITHFRTVIRTSIVLKRNGNNELIYEYQIAYRDENNEFTLKCAKFSLYDYTLEIKHVGDAQIII